MIDIKFIPNFEDVPEGGLTERDIINFRSLSKHPYLFSLRSFKKFLNFNIATKEGFLSYNGSLSDFKKELLSFYPSFSERFSEILFNTVFTFSGRYHLEGNKRYIIKKGFFYITPSLEIKFILKDYETCYIPPEFLKVDYKSLKDLSIQHTNILPF